MSSVISFRSYLSIFLIALFGLSGSGCLYRTAPSGPSCSIDTWLIGQWETTDKSNRLYHVNVIPKSSDRYTFEIVQNGRKDTFEGWISRFSDLEILVLKSLDISYQRKPYLLFHYDLITPLLSSDGESITRIRLTELQLDSSCCDYSDPLMLKQAIKEAAKKHHLFIPQDRNMSLSNEFSGGYIIWHHVGYVTFSGKTFRYSTL